MLVHVMEFTSKGSVYAVGFDSRSLLNNTLTQRRVYAQAGSEVGRCQVLLSRM